MLAAVKLASEVGHGKMKKGRSQEQNPGAQLQTRTRKLKGVGKDTASLGSHFRTASSLFSHSLSVVNIRGGGHDDVECYLC